ncbi:hypothetical protein B0T10DRAFT_419238 [Thelonectria olida]|uniref:Gfo/Idh/MocA-like oxidoreductase N-terminal domain-containing protein n=1 Tax=Thelonectria olida TaxID=1576542 RepID=A0A9P9AGL0_9HYPO|nr:hypothetical protein B0T10DRAFT_419238 [Thelonectria olida]
MVVIRLGIIGLSATNPGSWASVAHLPYLLSPRGKAHFKIVALCNSSIESARFAIETFQLPPDTRAYNSPNDLAQDNNIDLVVCSTRVDRHYDTIKQSIIAGKAVFVEWPLASNISQVIELADLAKKKGIKSMVGLQGFVNPPINAVREIVGKGLIGKVLSSEAKVRGGTSDRDAVPEALRYFTQSEVGGNVITIGFGHWWEYLLSILGDVEDIHSRLQLQRPQVKLISAKTGMMVETVKSDVPDLAFVTASLKGNRYVEKSASLSVNFRRGQPFPGEPHLSWGIYGEKGEIRFIAEGGTTPRTMASKPVSILWHDFSTGKVQEVGWSWEHWRQELPAAARGVAGLYEAYACEDRTAYSDFEHASKHHSHLKEILSSLY